MKKYFRIKLRIGENGRVYEEEQTIKFDLEQFYVGDGTFYVENSKIEGYVSLDYIKGFIANNKFVIIVYDFNDRQKTYFTLNLKSKILKPSMTYIFQAPFEYNVFAMLHIIEEIEEEEMLQENIENAKKHCESFFLF